ncbi:hypothetical protein QUA00_32905 [Microcoleus sp. T2B6]
MVNEILLEIIANGSGAIALSIVKRAIALLIIKRAIVLLNY